MIPEHPHAHRHLRFFDALCVVLGIIIGAGIFKAPALVAQNTANATMMLLAWAVGGFFCICGGLTYAELATSYPEAGGEYVYLSQAFGGGTGFLFVWARMTVIQTGAIAALAYVFGDYCTQIVSLGPASPMLYALVAVVILTLLNLVERKVAKWTMNLLAVATIGGLVAIGSAGALGPSGGAPVVSGASSFDFSALFGLGMVFVLYTFGGWNESAYVAGELKDVNRNMSRVIITSILMITVLYLVINVAYLRLLGFSGMRASEAVAADAMKVAFGRPGTILVSLAAIFAALSTINGSIFTGARAINAMGADHTLLGPLGQWYTRFGTPTPALLAQGAIALLLILAAGLGQDFRRGFETSVSFTAPVFWFFMLLIGIAVFVLRKKDPGRARPFRVPGYPVVPLIFCGMCLYMLYSSLAYSSQSYNQLSAWVGVVVLLAGIPLVRRMRRGGGPVSP
jgi:amino acid transporter